MAKKSKNKERTAGEKPKQAPAPKKQEESSFEWQPRHTHVLLGIILIASAIIGIASVVQFAKSPFFELPIIDEEAYVTWGADIASGNVLGDRIFYQDPLYPYTLGALFALFGKSFVAVRLFQVLIGVASVAVVFWTAKRIMGDKPALAAAGIMTAYRGLYFFEILLLKATMVIFFSAVSCALGVWASEKPEKKSRFFLVGLSLALLTLLRGNFQALLPFMFLWALVVERGAAWRQRALRAGVLFAGIMVVLAPVMIRNYSVGGELVLTTSQGGANFFIGNNARANGRYVTLPFVRANPKWESIDFEAEAEKRAGEELSPSQVSAFWFDESFDWIKENPIKWARLLVLKARLMIHQHEIPDNHSFYLTRDLFVPVLWLPLLGFGILWGPALVGVFALRQDRRSWYPALFAVLYAGSIIPFFIVARYRLAIVPAMAVFSAAALVWLGKKIDRKNRKAVVIAAVFLTITLFLGFWPTSVSKAPMGMEYYLLGNAYLKTERPEESIPWYDKALETLPDNKDVARNRAEAMRRLNTGQIDMLVEMARRPDATVDDLMEVGMKFEQLNQTASAVEIYKGVLSKDPDNFKALARLGFLLAASPQVEDTARALEYLHKALEVRPGHTDTMNAIGNVHFMRNEPEEAKKWYKAVLEIDPNHSGAQKNLKVLGAQEKDGK